LSFGFGFVFIYFYVLALAPIGVRIRGMEVHHSWSALVLILMVVSLFMSYFLVFNYKLFKKKKDFISFAVGLIGFVLGIFVEHFITEGKW
ncbi:MAG: hypothetical protein Q8P20_10215, partial [bacterium]|nr:hypothetical protein [bacterium]